jgi:hypothetical protein
MIAMSGERTAVTLPIRRIPPMMTRNTSTDVTSPVTHCGTPYEEAIESAMVFAWIAFPVMNAVVPRRTAKRTAIGFHFGPNPRSM